MFSHVLRKWWVFDRAVPAGRPRTVCGRLCWHVLPAGEALFGPAGPNLDAWIRDGLAELVKRGPQRTVYRVRLAGGDVFVKRCRINTPRAWLREVLRPAKARLEFENALALRARGIPSVEPLAWGARHPVLPGESLFITRCRDAAEPFERFLDATYPALPPVGRQAIRYRLAVELGAVVARMHDAGVAHPDPHPGNLLVEVGPGRPPRFTLIDLHAIRFGRPLSWAESLENLVLLNRWFQLRATRTDRARFWAAYIHHRSTLPTACPKARAAMARDVERRTERSNARFWNGRLGRYTKSNRQVRRVRGAAADGFATRDVPDTFLTRLLADPDAPFRDPTSRRLKDSSSATVVEVMVPTGDGLRPAIYKRFRVKSRLVLLKNLLRPSAAMRSWTYGHNVLDRGLPTARPLCVLLRRRAGIPAEGYLLTEKVPDALGLPEAVAAATDLPPGERRAVLRGWADDIGRLVRRLHDRRVAHRDLKAPNILMAGAARHLPTATPVLIDLVGVVPGRVVTAQTRVRNLARLNASFSNTPAVSRADRLRFLRAYLGWGLHGKGDWKSWWTRVAAATREKVAKNARTGRPLA
jgi:tRNA A-37 threonylcarbamoyl transferase component Bud32